MTHLKLLLLRIELRRKRQELHRRYEVKIHCKSVVCSAQGFATSTFAYCCGDSECACTKRLQHV